jgi:hypothetical protein
LLNHFSLAGETLHKAALPRKLLKNLLKLDSCADDFAFHIPDGKGPLVGQKK